MTDFAGLFNDCTREASKKRSGGRPRKKESDRRIKSISSSYTEAEYIRFLELASQANLTPSIFQREASLNAKVTSANIEAGLRIEKLQRIYSQLRKAGANIHKIERSTSHAPQLIALNKEAMETLQKINRLLDAITTIMRNEAGL